MASEAILHSRIRDAMDACSSAYSSAGSIPIPSTFGYRYRIDTFSKWSIPKKGGKIRGNGEKSKLIYSIFSRIITPFRFFCFGRKIPSYLFLFSEILPVWSLARGFHSSLVYNCINILAYRTMSAVWRVLGIESIPKLWYRRGTSIQVQRVQHLRTRWG